MARWNDDHQTLRAIRSFTTGPNPRPAQGSRAPRCESARRRASRCRLEKTAKIGGNPRRAAVADRRDQRRGGDELLVVAQHALLKLNRRARALARLVSTVKRSSISAGARYSI